MKIIQIQDEYLFVKSAEPYQIGMLIESMRKVAAACPEQNSSKVLLDLNETHEAVKRLHVETSQ